MKLGVNGEVRNEKQPPTMKALICQKGDGALRTGRIYSSSHDGVTGPRLVLPQQTAIKLDENFSGNCLSAVDRQQAAQDCYP